MCGPSRRRGKLDRPGQPGGRPATLHLGRQAPGLRPASRRRPSRRRPPATRPGRRRGRCRRRSRPAPAAIVGADTLRAPPSMGGPSRGTVEVARWRRRLPPRGGGLADRLPTGAPAQVGEQGLVDASPVRRGARRTMIPGVQKPHWLAPAATKASAHGRTVGQAFQRVTGRPADPARPASRRRPAGRRRREPCSSRIGPAGCSRPSPSACRAARAARRAASHRRRAPRRRRPFRVKATVRARRPTLGSRHGLVASRASWRPARGARARGGVRRLEQDRRAGGPERRHRPALARLRGRLLRPRHPAGGRQPRQQERARCPTACRAARRQGARRRTASVVVPAVTADRHAKGLPLPYLPFLLRAERPGIYTWRTRSAVRRSQRRSAWSTRQGEDPQGGRQAAAVRHADHDQRPRRQPDLHAQAAVPAARRSR